MSTAWNALPMLDRIVDDVMNGVGGTALGTVKAHAGYSPAIDVRSSPEEIVFVCDVPGVKEGDLEVTLTAGALTIRGHRKYEGSMSDQVWLGRTYGSFQRSFTLPDTVDADDMTADLADGVLTIRVPKKPQARPRSIPIGGGRSGKLLKQRQE